MSARRATSALLGVAVLLAAGVAACGGDGDAAPDAGTPAAVGRALTQRSGCTACHGTDGEGQLGPPWVGTLGTTVELEDGSTVVVDQAYLTRAIADPHAEVRAGFSVQMPENQLTDAEIADIVAYIVSLSEDPSTGSEG